MTYHIRKTCNLFTLPLMSFTYFLPFCTKNHAYPFTFWLCCQYLYSCVVLPPTLRVGLFRCFNHPRWQNHLTLSSILSIFLSSPSTFSTGPVGKYHIVGSYFISQQCYYSPDFLHRSPESLCPKHLLLGNSLIQCAETNINIKHTKRLAITF